MSECYKCNSRGKYQAYFCNKCYAELEAKMKECPMCYSLEKDFNTNGEYCKDCGYKFNRW